MFGFDNGHPSVTNEFKLVGLVVARRPENWLRVFSWSHEVL